MARVKVRLADNIARVVFVDPEATKGARLGTNLYTPDGELGTPETVRNWLGLGVKSTLQHKNLQGLQVGDDHPQYTMWAAKERITGQWNFEKQIWGADGTAALPEYTFTADTNTGIYRVGADNLGISTNGVARWDVNTARVQQTVPLIISIPVPAESGEHVAFQVQADNPLMTGGIEFTIENLSTPTDNDVGGQIGIWEEGASSGPLGRQYPPAVTGTGFRWRLEGSEGETGDLVFYSHQGSSSGSEIYRHHRNRAQMLFASGSAAFPTIAFGASEQSGLWWDAVSGRVSAAVSGSTRVGLSASELRVAVQITANPGTAEAPSYSFSGDDDTGVYKPSINSIGISAGGVNRLTISASAVAATPPFRGAGGTAEAPSYSFSDDTNTGMYSIGADVLGFAAGGTERMRLGAAGLLAAVPLLGQDGTASAPAFSFGTDTDTGVYLGAEDTLYIVTNGAVRLGIGAAGEILDSNGSPGLAGEVPTSAGADTPWVWGQGGGGGGGGSGGLVYVNTSVPSENTVANTTTETVFDSQYEIPADRLQEGSVIRVRAAGVYGTDSVAPTVRIRVRLGGATILDSGDITAIGSLTDEGWSLDGQMVVFTDGDSGTLDAQGVLRLANSASASQIVALKNSSTASIDTTDALVLDVSVEWGTADEDNTITLRELALDVLDASEVTPTGQTTGCHVQRIASLSVPTSNTEVMIPWDTEVADDGGYWASTPNPTRLTIRKTGWHNITASVTWGSASGTPVARIAVNGAALTDYDVRSRTEAQQSESRSLAVAGNFYLHENDYVEIGVQINMNSRTVVGATASIVSL